MALSHKSLSELYTFKSWNAMWKGQVFFIWFWFEFYSVWYCPLRTGAGVFIYTYKKQNLLTLTKVIYWWACWVWKCQEQSPKSTCLCSFKIYTLFRHINNKFMCFVHFMLVYQIMLSPKIYVSEWLCTFLKNFNFNFPHFLVNSFFLCFKLSLVGS